MAKIIGITGGIASGKSTVTNYLRQKGYQVIDADQVVHELQKLGGRLYQALLSEFGTEILLADGQLDRKKLGALLFSRPNLLEKSSRLQNDIIREELANRRDQLAKTEETFFMDIPLLFEQDYADWFDEVWLVYVNPETQIKRLKARNGYSQEEAQQRLASQMKLEDKVPYADFVIKNDGNLEELIEQIDKKLRRLRNDESNGL